MDKEFEYDIAFSFNAENEAIVRSIVNSFKNKLNVFAYYDRQKELAGNDGLIEFSTVFKDKSRLVVIIISKSWGKTPWTRIEMEAVQQRHLNEGSEFILFVRVDECKLPPWYSSTKLYVDFDEKSVREVASIIEFKFQQLDGVLEELTAEDILRIKLQEKKEQELLIKYLRSREAVDDQEKYFNGLKKLIHEKVLDLKSKHNISVGRPKENLPWYQFVLPVEGHLIQLYLDSQIRNTTEKDYLKIKILKRGDDFNANYSTKHELIFNFSKKNNEPVWKKSTEKDEYFLNHQIVEHIMKLLVNSQYGEDRELFFVI